MPPTKHETETGGQEQSDQELNIRTVMPFWILYLHTETLSQRWPPQRRVCVVACVCVCACVRVCVCVWALH